MKKILLTGDSLIEFFDWQSRFPQYGIANEGIAGETVRGLLYGLPSLEARVEIPDVIVLMIGTNNLAMDDYAFLGDYQEIVEKFREWYPDARVVITSLLPLYLPWLAPDAVQRLNESLERIVENPRVDLLDVFSQFRAEGRGERDLFLEDGVHLSDAGYAVWSRVLGKYFTDIFS